MVGNLQTSMFLLFAFVLPVNAIDPGEKVEPGDKVDPVMALVNICPKNESDVIQASNRLGCGKDKYDNNQYLCLPNKNKTSLVEFCYQGVMGLLEKGNCIEFSEGKWIYHNCNHFLNGCPEKNLEVFEIYKYPACQNINTHLQCYVMEKNCTAQSDTGESSGENHVILITFLSIGVILFIISCIIIIFFYKRRMANRNKKKGDTDKSYDETSTLLSGGDQEKVTDKAATSVSERNKENFNFELENSKPGEGDQEKVTDRTATPVSGEGDQEKVTDRTATPVSGIASWKDNEIRIVLIGRTGSGKSATGNSILGEKRFISSGSGSSVTRACAHKSTVRFLQKILVVDTPGIFDTNESFNYVQKEIMKCISISSPGPHAFILVLSFTRFTAEVERSVQHFVDVFGENIFKYLFVIFTRGDDLEEEGVSLIDYVENAPPNLQAFIKKCEGRVIAFNNRLKGKKCDNQVQELLSMIYKNMEKNNGECYRNEMYREAEKALQKKEDEIRKQAELKREQEIQKMRKEISEEYAKQAEKQKILQDEKFEKWKKEFVKRQEEKFKDAERNTQKKYEQIVGMTREIAREEVEKGIENSVIDSAIDTVWDSAKLLVHVPGFFSKLK